MLETTSYPGRNYGKYIEIINLLECEISLCVHRFSPRTITTLQNMNLEKIDLDLVVNVITHISLHMEVHSCLFDFNQRGPPLLIMALFYIIFSCRKELFLSFYLVGMILAKSMTN